MTKDETIQELARQLARKSRSLRRVTRDLNGAFDTHAELKKKLGQAYADKQATSNEFGKERAAKLELERHCRHLEDEIARIRKEALEFVTNNWDLTQHDKDELSNTLGIVK
jgi:chromosome segregation ATPase